MWWGVIDWAWWCPSDEISENTRPAQPAPTCFVCDEPMVRRPTNWNPTRSVT